MINVPLWTRVHYLVYRRPTAGFPFPREACSYKIKPASWLYHTLAADPALCAKVFHG